MEQTINALINVIETEYQSYLDELSDAEITLSAPSTIAMSDIDIGKYRNSVSCFILPDDEDYETETLTEDSISQRVYVYIFIRKDSKEALTKKAMRHSKAFRKMIKENNTLNNEVGYIHTDKSEYYDGVEGTDSIKGLKLSLSVLNEDI